MNVKGAPTRYYRRQTSATPVKIMPNVKCVTRCRRAVTCIADDVVTANDQRVFSTFAEEARGAFGLTQWPSSRHPRGDERLLGR